MTDVPPDEGPIGATRGWLPSDFDLRERLPDLILPTPDEDVLLENERILYRRPRHWAVLLPIIGDLIAVTVLLIAFVILPPWADFLRGLLVVPTLVYIVIRTIVSDHKFTWQTFVLLAVGPAILSLMFGLSVGTIMAGLFLDFAIRLVHRIVRWRWFFITYITDRRLIQTNGLIIRQVLTMPIGRITDVSTKTQPLGDLLGYAEFRVETAGSIPMLNRIDYLADFETFYRIVLTITTQQSERARDLPPDGT
jgi:membrane protein YdbS with pleckstrin-like domain